jgi:hypothetical protein
MPQADIVEHFAPHFEQRSPSLMGRHRDVSGSAETSNEILALRFVRS